MQNVCFDVEVFQTGIFLLILQLHFLLFRLRASGNISSAGLAVNVLRFIANEFAFCLSEMKK